MKFFSFLLFFLLVISSGCANEWREKDLHQREIALHNKEQELSLWERTLQQREEALALKEKQADSTFRDTTAVYNPALEGTWTVRMVATETTCAGSAVGDTRNENWNISYTENNRIVARATTGNQLVRVYTGIFTGNTVELIEDRGSSPSQPATRMVVRLRLLLNERSMEGQREIIRENDCKIIYSLTMTKQQ